MSDWQPIETIPMDGTPVLVWLPRQYLGSRIHVATYRPNVKLVAGRFAFDLDRPPSHWRILPPAPGDDWRDRASEPKSDLMEQYEAARHAEYRLDEAIETAIGGPDWWKEGGGGLPFDDWYYDTYDSSVELLGTVSGWAPTAEMLAKLYDAGIRIVFVSYAGHEADSYGTRESPAALAWSWSREKQAWSSGLCGARTSPEHKAGSIRDLKRALKLADELAGAAAAFIRARDRGYIQGMHERADQLVEALSAYLESRKEGK